MKALSALGKLDEANFGHVTPDDEHETPKTG